MGGERVRADARCLICHLNQTLRVLNIYTRSSEERWKKVQDMMNVLKDLKWGLKPIEIAQPVYRELSRFLEREDPYEMIKRRSNSMAESILKKLRREIENSSDPLYDAAKLAIAGNLIDLGNPNWDEDRVFDRVIEVLEKPFGINDFEEFKEDLRNSSTVLYIVDNAGEIVFDKFFIEIMKDYNRGLSVTVAARRSPIINDATIDDVLSIGMDEVAEVIDSGMDIPGTVVERATEEFRKLFYGSDMVVSKGQGNFEGLEEERRDIYFLLTVKCDVVAEYLETTVGTLVFMKKR